MSNVDVVRGIYAAFAKGDVPGVLGALDPNIAWSEADGFPYPGTFNGPDAVLNGVFMKLGGEWDGWGVAPDDYIAEGDKVVSLGFYSGKNKATGKSFRAHFAHVWTFNNGKPIKFQQYTDTAIIKETLT